MQVKTQLDDFQNYLTDASNLAGGRADKLFLPETTEEIQEILREANEKKISVTISGARTGTVGGAIPFGGYIISLEKLNQIKEINEKEKFIVVESGVILNDLQKAVEAKNLFYPPDPTEWSCQIGGTVATNASGARSFKYGATRNFVKKLKVVLSNGDLLSLKRGENFAEDGKIELTTVEGNKFVIKLPTYNQPSVRKNASGYYASDNLDAIDLFVGSEGTLGIFTEIELELLAKPEGFLSGIVFFKDKNNLLDLVNDIKQLSIDTRKNEFSTSNQPFQIDAALIEYFDEKALDFISERFPETPSNMAGAIFFEQETNSRNEDELFEQWNSMLEKHHAEIEKSWFTTSEQDNKKMREFRHALPVAVNERIVRYRQRKVGTDMSVPDENFASFLKFYEQKLNESNLDYVIFGHIGDNHLHANILPKNESEAERAKHLYGRFVAQAIMLGGAISAEHGVGKLKRKYLEAMFGERYLNEMAEIKKTLDPNGILSRGNMFDERFLSK